MAGPGLSIAASKLAGLGLAAKIGVGATIATASMAGAGAAGVLPDAANERAREAIEAVTPVDFEEPAGDHGKPADDGRRNGGDSDNFGGTVSADATGEADGEPGVDGREISSMAPGADHRPADRGQAPAQAEAPEAGDAPADPPADAGVAEETPSTVPDSGAPASVPSTVPASGAPDAPGGQRPTG